MNIFYLESSAEKSARDLCDKHIPKMLLETCQMLSTGIRTRLENPDDATLPLYKVAYPKHPSTIWVGSSLLNFRWAQDLGRSIAEQYTFRFGKIHKSERIINWLDTHNSLVERAFSKDAINKFTPPPQCMPDHYKDEDTITAYRNYYFGDKRPFAKWEKGVAKPFWFRFREEREARDEQEKKNADA